MSNLRQWGIVFQLYTNDNNNSFHQGFRGMPDSTSNWWYPALESYYEIPKIRFCPMATKLGFLRGGKNLAWGPFDGDYYGSYGINGWIPNPDRSHAYITGAPTKNNWRTNLVAEHTDGIYTPTHCQGQYFLCLRCKLQRLTQSLCEAQAPPKLERSNATDNYNILLRAFFCPMICAVCDNYNRDF